MDNNTQILILKIIKFNGDVSPLVKMGYEYSQIADFIKQEIVKGNAERINGTLMITKQGNEFIENLNSSLKRANSELWIEPEIASKISTISINDIFLPNQDELSF